MTNRHLTLSAAILAVLVTATSCTTEYRTYAPTTPRGEAGDYTNQHHVDPLDVHDENIAKVVAAVPGERQGQLLRSLEFLIAQKKLAVAPILKAIPDASPRALSSYLFVLGYIHEPAAREELARHLNHEDGIVRYEAIAGLLQHGDLSVVPTALDLLESPDRAIRFKTIESLRAAIGRDFDYNFAANDEVRAKSVTAWKSWWQNERRRLMTREVASPAATGERTTSQR